MATSNSTDFEPNVTEFIEEAYETMWFLELKNRI